MNTHDGQMMAVIKSRYNEYRETLDLTYHNIYGPHGVRYITDSDLFEELRILRLAGTKIEEWGLRLLSEAKFLPTIEELDLASNDLPCGALLVFLEKVDFRALRVLDLSHNKVGDVGVSQIARNPKFRKLEWLELSAASLTEKGIIELLRSENLPTLISLDVTWNKEFPSREVQDLVREVKKKRPGLRVYLDEDQEGKGQ